MITAIAAGMATATALAMAAAAITVHRKQKKQQGQLYAPCCFLMTDIDASGCFLKWSL
jgi:uncharacterized protein YegL